MTWFITIVVLVIVAALVIAFLNRFYRKATREVALVRTGAGGQKVVIDGGCLSLPFLHQVSEVNMKTIRLEVARSGNRSLITEDRLRVDATVEFFMRVSANEDAIATASQTLGGKSFRPEELAEMIGGKLIDGVQGVIARHTLDHLHENRQVFVRDVRDAVTAELEKNGLQLETVALTQLDQTPFDALNENNAFNAVGMRRLAEVIAQNKKQRAAIENEADVAVRQSRLEAVKRKLRIDQEEEQAQIEQTLELESLKANQSAEIAERQADAERRSDAARIAREREVRAAEIARDKELRMQELSSRLNTDLADRDNAIALARKSVEEIEAQVSAENARAERVSAEEQVQTGKDRAVAERARMIAVIRAKEQAEVESERLKSDVETIREEALAKADALSAASEAKKTELLAEAEGRAALVRAENGLTPELIRMKVDMHRMDTLPTLMSEMMKPVEKIEGIRIHNISGLGGGRTGGDGSSKPVVNQAIDGLMEMAVQLPALQKLGREIGVNLEDGLAGLADSATGDKGEPASEEKKDDD